MRRYEQTVAALKLHGTREAQCFEEALLALQDDADREKIVNAVAALLTWHVENPRLSVAPPCHAGPSRNAARLCGALGLHAPHLDLEGVFSLAAPKTAVTLEKLRIGAAALRAFQVVAAERATESKTATLKAEPDLGAAGTTSLVLIDETRVKDTRVHRRRFAADETFDLVLEWARVVLDRADPPTLACRAPKRDLEVPRDASKTLQSLGLWPGATLELADPIKPPAPPPRPPSTAARKPKPSEIFKAVARARKSPTEKRRLLAAAHEKERAPAPAPAPVN